MRGRVVDNRVFGYEPFNEGKGVSASRLRDAICKDGVPEALVDRFQAVVAGPPPSREEFAAVVKLHLNAAIRLKSLRQGRSIKISKYDSFLANVVDRYYYAGMSNRVALEIVQNHFRTALADQLLRASKTESGNRSCWICQKLRAQMC